MILLGETNNAAREVAFHLPDVNDPLTGITGHVFVTGEVKVRVPGGVYVDADIARIVEKGFGDYALQLTDAQVAAEGKVYLRALVSVAQPWTGYEDIISGSALAGAIGGVPVASAQRVWTLAMLRKAVLRRAGIRDAVGTEASADLTAPVLDEFINEAIAELWDLLKKKNDDRLVTTATLNATANVAAVTLPSGFYTLRKLEIVDPSAPSGYRQLHSIALEAKHLYSAVTNKQYKYWSNNYNVELVPTPTQNETLRLYYVPVAPILVNDSDAIDGYNGYEELIIQLAFRRVLVRQDLDPSPANEEITRLSSGINERADARDAEPFYLDPRGSNRRDWDDDWEPY